MIQYILWLSNHTAFPWLAGASAGLIIGIWLDHFLRKSEAKKGSGIASEKVLKEIQNKAFTKHETVPVDGYRFISCEFRECVLKYEGGHYEFIDCRFYSKTSMATSSNVIGGALGIAEVIGLFKDQSENRRIRIE